MRTAYTSIVALSHDTGLVCYDRQERWVNSGGQANVPPECRINGSQVFCMRFRAMATQLKTEDGDAAAPSPWIPLPAAVQHVYKRGLPHTNRHGQMMSAFDRPYV